jgi:hypothetical protein
MQNYFELLTKRKLISKFKIGGDEAIFARYAVAESGVYSA